MTRLRDNNENKRKRLATNEITVLSMLLALALALGFAERHIPIGFIVPGVRLGLANVAVLASLYLFSFKGAFIVAVLKCTASLFFAGSATGFIYSLSGSLLSLSFMALASGLLGNKISPVGVSVIGAVFHNTGQVCAASAVMRTRTVFAYLPMLVIAGVLTGVIVGISVKYVLRILLRIRK